MKVKLNLKIRLLKEVCISIVMHGCETWVLTEALNEKLDIFVRTYYHIMIGIKQSRDHITNKSLNQLTDQEPLRKTIRQRQIKFTGIRSQDNVRQTNLPTDLSFMNQGSGHFFDQEHQGRHISIKFRRKLYKMGRKLLKPERLERWR